MMKSQPKWEHNDSLIQNSSQTKNLRVQKNVAQHSWLLYTFHVILHTDGKQHLDTSVHSRRISKHTSTPGVYWHTQDFALGIETSKTGVNSL